MKNKFVTSAAIVAVLSFGTQWASGKSAALSHNDFSFRMFEKIAGNHSGSSSNFVYSPFSIGALLSMVFEGSNGATRDQILQVLGTKEVPLDNSSFYLQLANGQLPNFKSVNGFWVDQRFSVLESFREVMAKKYGAQVRNVDFAGNSNAVRVQVNRWIEDGTGKKIRNLLRPNDVTSDTQAVLVNAVHFLEKWEKAFDRRFSGKRWFRPEQDRPVKTDFMQATDRFHYYQDNDVRLIKVRYRSKTASMVFLMPAEPGQFKHLALNLTAARFNRWVSQAKPRRVRLSVPKFKLEQRSKLKPALSTLGMVNAFSPTADFSRMTHERGVYVSKVIHEAFIRTDEDGTEAAGATAAVFTRGGAVSFVELTFDRPFLFFVIHEPTNSVLFMGRYVNP